MGLLDILGAGGTVRANQQGNYLQGQAAGQQQAQQNLLAMLNAKRQKTLDEQTTSANALNAAMKLHQEGFVPEQQVQGDLASTQRAQFGQSAGVAPGDIGGLAAMAINAPKAQELASGLQQRVVNPYTKQGYAFSYDDSPQGIIEKRTNAVNAEKAKEKQQASVAEIADRLNRIRAADPSIQPQRAGAIARDPKLYDAWALQAFELNPKVPTEDRSSVAVLDPNDPTGKRTILVTKSFATANRMSPAAGAGKGDALAAPMAAKVGQFGEMLKKARDVYEASGNMNVTVGQSAAEDIAAHGLGVGGLRIPGTKGVGSLMVNNSPAYSQYQAALSPFILAAAHALSGARINQDQVEQIRKSIELKPGDFANPNVVRQKEKNFIDLINSIGGSLPKNAITDQEGQMSEDEIQSMVKRGYKRVGGAATSVTPNGGGRAGGAGHPLANKYGLVLP